MEVLATYFMPFFNVRFILKYNKRAKNNIKGKMNVFQMFF